MTATERMRGAQVAAVALLLAITACAPQAAPASGPNSQGREQAPPVAPKILTVGILAEPKGFLVGGGPGGASTPNYIAHDGLVVLTNTGEYMPQLAIEQISAAKGTWVINPDGSMDTTWRIYPTITWQDGVPFTSADLLFSAQVNNDRGLPTRKDPGVELIQSMDAPDPTTLHVRWSGVFAFANRAPGLTPLPQHLLGEAYQTSKADLPNNPYFTTDFVGLGPYRLATWVPGSYQEFTRFEGYYRGLPPLDRVILRFVGSGNGAVVAILAGQVDAVVGSGVALDAAAEVKERWEGTGNQVLWPLSGGIQQLLPQSRPEYAKPSALLNRSVRQALMYALDRQELTNAVTLGLAPVADAWVRPDEALWPQVESAIPRYPYNPARAQQLLTEAGWIRGSDGVLAHQPDGERFEQPLATPPNQPAGERVISIIGDYWKAVGVQPILGAISQAEYADDEYLAKAPFPKLSGSSAENSYLGNLNTKTIATAQNGWRGKNQTGYSNPRFDAITDRLAVTIDPAQWVQLQREALQEAMTDVALMPLYWALLPTMLLKGVKAHPAIPDRETWDFFYWDKE